MRPSVIAPPGRSSPFRTGDRASLVRSCAAGAVAVLLGLSPVVHGGYAPSLWLPCGIVAVVAALVLAIASPPRPTWPAGLAVGGLAGLGLWSLVSERWAPSASLAGEDGQRLLALAALLSVLLLLIRDRRAAVAALGGAATGVLAVAVWTTARLLTGDSAAVLLTGRLNDPLGYVNGQGSIYVLAALAALAVAGSARSTLLAGPAAASATLLAGLALLCQSRGVLAALVVGSLVVVVAVGGRVRRAWATVLLAAVLVVIAPTLGEVLARTTYRGTPTATVHDAARVLVLAAVAVGLAWGLAVAVVSRARGASRARARTASRAVLAAVVGAAVLVAVVRAPAIVDRVGDQYRAFVGVEVQADATGGSRLFSGAGTRYDYWRIAWGAFRDEPVVGEGAGGFVVPYFRERRTTEDVLQAHSVVFGTLAELGLVGAALLLALVAGLGAGVVRAARRTGADPTERGLAAAGAGMTAAWLLHASVDWILLLPGVTGVAFVGVALTARAASAPGGAGDARERRSGPWGRRRAWVATVAVAAVAVVAVTGMTRRLLAEHAESAARAAVATDPARAVRLADRAIRLDRDRMDAYYLRAAALARAGDAASTLATLRAALARQPDSFVTWALLGDVQRRTGELGAARRSYRTALRLNPRDPGLRASLRAVR